MAARRLRAGLVIGVALCFFAAMPLGAQAAAGDLDPSFASGGKVMTALGAGSNTAVAAAGGFGALNDSATAQARSRAVTDMPDDVSGSQVHFLYIVPSDGGDRQLDTNGGMEESITRIERWFETQTGDQALRIDTYKSAPDITFVRLPHSDAQATATNPWPLWVIGEDLVAAGFNNPAKVYAAFYDGHSTWACGGAYSPALPKLGAMYLQAHPTNDPRPCRDAPGFGAGTDRPGYFEIGLLHEVMHTLGFSPHCAPHHSESAFPDHVHDSPTDLMYGPDATHTAGNWANAVLDFNRDDYYRAHVPGCYDLSDNPYLAALHPVSVTVTGPGTVTSSPAGIDCPGTCSGKFQGSVTLTATPSVGAGLKGWTGACSGTAACVVTGEGSVAASFVIPSHRRTLTLRVHGRRAKGALRVVDGYAPCRIGAAVSIERRGERGWSIIERARTDRAGLFSASLPKGRATYRARASEGTANGQKCVKAVSRVRTASA
jgi:Divergent InlB B-repeat domain